MNDEFLPFSRPTIDQDTIEEVVNCVKSGWLTTGPRVSQFTDRLKEYFNAPYVLPLSSATAGLHLSLLAMGVQPDDEVITTPFTFAATLNSIILSGAKLVLVDIDLNTLNIDLNQLEDAISEKTKIIMPVHFAGLPVDLDLIYQIAEEHHVRVLEDAAHAIGAMFNDKRIGSFGDTQVFSFHPNKNMTTGEGGCVVTRDAELAHTIRLLSFHGMDRPSWTGDYEIVLPGYKYNMMDLQAALGLHQLKKLHHFILRRKELATRYQDALSDWAEWTLPSRPCYPHQHAWHLYTPLLNLSEVTLNRDEFIQKMNAKNIGVGLHYRAAHLYPYYRERFGFKLGDFPCAENAAERIVSLPLFPSMTDAEHDRVLDVMYSIFH